MSKRILILALGDTHAGSEFGLLHPDTQLERENEVGEVVHYTPELSEIQKLLFYELFQKGINELISFANKDDVYVVHNGDITQGDVHTDEVVSPVVSKQLFMAMRNMEEILQYPNVKALRLLKGTSIHGFGNGSADELVTKMLQLSHPDKDIAVHNHGQYTIKDVDFMMDVAHHGVGAGQRKWLEGNNFRYYIKNIMISDGLMGKRIADVYMRSHTHTALEEHLTLNGHRSWGLILPPMQFPTGFARQVMKSIYEVTMGMVVIEVIKLSETRKIVYPHWMTKTIDIRTKEIL